MQIDYVTSINTYIRTQKMTFKSILVMNFNFGLFLHGFHCLNNETDSPFNLTLQIICQSNANFKTEWVIKMNYCR